MSLPTRERGLKRDAPLTAYVYIDEDPNILGADRLFCVLQHWKSANIAPLEDDEFALIGTGPEGKLGDRATVEGN